MATTLAVFNPAANLPAFAKGAKMSEMALAIAGGMSTGKRISVRGGVFRLFSDGKEIAAIEDRYLDVVLVASAKKVSRTLYLKTYDENVNASPDCWSKEGDLPDPAVKTPQAASCATCPKNVKGSGQGDSRACRYNQRLAVVLANNIEGDIMQLTLAATSIFGRAEGDNRPLQEYARYLIAQNIDPGMLVTRLRFDTAAAVPKLFFKAMRWLTDEEYAAVQTAATHPDALRAITYTVFQQDSAVAAPLALAGGRPQAAKPAPEPVPAPAEEEEAPPPPPKAAKPTKAAKAAPAAIPDDEPPPEPTVQKAQTTAKPAASAGLAATLAAWDDE